MGVGLRNFPFTILFLGGELVMKKSEIWVWGGVYFGPLEKGGGVEGGSEKWGGFTRLCHKMGGVGIWRPKAADFVHPPPSDVFDSFPYTPLSWWSPLWKIEFHGKSYNPTFNIVDCGY